MKDEAIGKFPHMKISFSVVSHGHGDHIMALLDSLATSGLLLSGLDASEVLLTLNVPEPKLKPQVDQRSWPFRLIWIENTTPLGFGANHNQAFAQASGDVFAVINPDITFLPGSLSGLTSSSDDLCGVWVPSQVDKNGSTQDYCRKLMTPWGMLVRTAVRLGGLKKLPGAVTSVEQSDWVNAACLFFPSEVYRALSGFDERYFMYCEDADLCMRLQLQGWRMQSAPFTVVHDAQRGSLRPGKHLRWHVTSLLRFWCSSAFWRYWFRSWKPFNRVTSVKS